MELPIWAARRQDQPIMFYFSSLQCIGNIHFISAVGNVDNLSISNEICTILVCLHTYKDRVEKTCKIVARSKGQFTAAGRPSALDVSGLTPLQRARVSHERVSTTSIFDAPRCDLPIPSVT